MDNNKINMNKDFNSVKNNSKNESQKEIKTEQNSDRKIYANKLIYNKSELFDKNNKYIINKIKRLDTDNSKGSINRNNKKPENKRNKIPKMKKNLPNIICSNNNLLSEFLKKKYSNFSGTPSRQLLKDRNNIPINFYSNLLKKRDIIPITTTSSLKISNNFSHINNCQSFDGHKDLCKHIKCITQHNKRINSNMNNMAVKNIMNIPTGKNKIKKEFILRKISPDSLKRKNTYTKEKSQFIKERRINRIKSIVIKRHKSINSDSKNIIKMKSINYNFNFNNNPRKYNSIKNLHKSNNKSEILIKDNSFNSLNSKSKNINSSYESNFISKNYINSNNRAKNENVKINNNLIKNHFYHQKFPTISSVQYSILNNFNNYKIISSNIKMKRINNNCKTLSNQLNLHKNILNNNIKYKKINMKNKHKNINYHRKQKENEINSLLNYLEKSINNSELTEDNFENNTINKTTINKNILPNVELNNFLIRTKPVIINNENESNNYKKNSSSNNKLNNYLSPKNNNSQIFNNYYSFNNVETTNIPVKVINIYKNKL